MSRGYHRNMFGYDAWPFELKTETQFDLKYDGDYDDDDDDDDAEDAM